jgi:hypothetical protein
MISEERCYGVIMEFLFHEAYVYLSLVCACNVHVQADTQVRVCQCVAST